ncbi:MAG: hypothetical protein KDB00_12410 [Planctomycetales bacterium]|nr:hypothetical protein [Planctomycetales bacterium]
MFHFSFQALDLFLLVTTIALLLGWLGSWLQRGPQQLQRWCEASIGLSLLIAVVVFVPIPRPSFVESVSPHLSSRSTVIENVSVPTAPSHNVDLKDINNSDASLAGISNFENEIQKESSSIDWRQLLRGFYVAGIIVCVALLLAGRLRLRWIESVALRTEGSPEVPSCARLMVSPRASRPFCFGIFHARIILPPAVAESQYRQHVIRHELVHLQRRDALSRAVMNVALPLLYINPFYWLLRRSAILASEHIADARASEATSIDAYSTGMIELARVLNTPRPLLPVAGGWANQTTLTRRVQWLLQNGCESPPCNKRWAGLSLCLAVCLLCSVTFLFGCTPETTRRGDLKAVDDSDAGCIWSMTADLPGIAAQISGCDVKTVSGQVLDGDTPVGDAEVWAVGYGRIGGREKVVTDGDGRFKLGLPIEPPMAIDSWRIVAFKGDQCGQSGKVSDDGHVTIKLKDGRAVEIEVRDRSTGELVSDARLFLEDGRIIDAPNGHLRIAGLPSDDLYKLVVAGPGHARRAVQVDLHSDQQTNLIVKLEQGGRIHGQVVDQSGAPVPGNPVGMGMSHMGLQPAMRQITDDDGRYSLIGVPVNQPVRITTYSHRTPGGSNWEATTVTVPGDESAQVDFTVVGDHAAPPESKSPGIRALYSDRPDPGRGAIRGRVLLPSGEPATEFELSFEWPRDWQPGEEIISGGAVGNACLFTPNDGRFEFTGLEKGGTYRLIAAAPGYQDAVVNRVHAVAIGDLGSATPIELQLKPTTQFVVTVNDSAQQPVLGAEVWLVPEDPKRALDTHKFVRRRMHGQTDTNGQVKFPAVPFADGVLIIEKENMGTEQVPWNGTNTTVTLSEPANLIVQISRPSGTSKRVDVFLQRDGSNTMTAQVAKPNDRNVEFKNITTAKYSLSIDSADYKLDSDSWQQPIGLVEPGSTKTVTLKLLER